MINSIGLPTKGIDYFFEHQVPDYRRFTPPLVGSISATRSRISQPWRATWRRATSTCWR